LSGTPSDLGERIGRPVKLACFSRRLRLDRQRVHAARQFRGQRRINHAMTLDPALSFEGGRHDIQPEMCLAARLVASMAFMKM